MYGIATISGLLLLCIASIIAIHLCLRGKWNRLYVVGFIYALIGTFSFFVIRNYTLPSKAEKIYGSADYHKFEHRGFEFDKKLILANDKNSNQALWDHKNGILEIETSDSIALTLQNFYEPLYIKKTRGYQLANVVYSIDFSNKLVLHKDGQPWLELTVTKKKSLLNSYYEFSFFNAENNKDGTFADKKHLQIGYPLLDFIEQAGVPVSSEIQEILENCYLLRHEIFVSGQKENNSALLFFPSAEFAANKDITLSANGTDFIAALPNGQPQLHRMAFDTHFFTGIGKQQSKVYTVQKDTSILGLSQLLYRMPERFHLKNDSLNNLFISSQIEQVAQHLLKDGFFFPGLSNVSNKNHINADLRYYNQMAGSSMEFKVTDHEADIKDQTIMVKANEKFSLNTKNETQQLKWIFSFKDFRATNPLKIAYLYIFVLSFLILSLATLYFNGFEKMKPFEVTIYILAFSFLLIRIILQWRMSTFPPIEDVGYNTFTQLRSISHFRYTCIATLLFFIIRWSFILIDKYNYSFNISSYRKKYEKLDWVVNFIEEAFLKNGLKKYLSLHLVLLAFSFALQLINDRIANIGLPVILFFGFYYFIQKQKKTYNQPKELKYFNGIQSLNAVITLLYLAVNDAGFSLIFLLFLMLSYCFKQITEIRNGSISGISLTLGKTILVFVALAIWLFWGSNLLSSGFEWMAKYKTWMSAGILTMVGASLVVLLKQFTDDKKRYLLAPISFAVLLFTGLQVFPKIIDSSLEKFNYIKHRADVQHKPIDEIISNTSFNSNSASSALRAAQNQWFIKTYFDESKKRRDAYFKLQDHFNKGVSYTTQTTDLVVTRYIIAEHSEHVMRWIILSLLLIVFVFFLKYRLHHNENESTAFMLLLLLFTISLFVWLTSTNRFIFFGQDLPLISLTSIFTLFLSLVILAASIQLAQNCSPQTVSHYTRHLRICSIPFLVIILFGFFIDRSDSTLSDKDFDLSQAISGLREDVVQLNKYLIGHQQILAKTKVKFDDDHLDDLVTLLNDKIGFNKKDRLYKNVINDQFSRSAYEDFVDRANKRDANHILHFRKNKEGYFFLAVNLQYYRINPPKSYQDRWTGDLIAARDNQGYKFVTYDENRKSFNINDELIRNYRLPDAQLNPDIKISVIPSIWTPHDAPRVLISVYRGLNQSTLRIQNNEEEYRSTTVSTFQPTIQLANRDLISMIGGSKTNSYFLEKEPKNYLMKNLWLNGDRKKFYPLGDQFLWPYHYANCVDQAYSSEKEKQNKNEQVSIDYELTEDIAAIFKKYSRQLRSTEYALSILDANGSIRAIVDYKPGQELLNPNKWKSLNKRNKELYLNINLTRERNLKGNLNLMHMKIGPGSSIKPIIYSAVTSQARLPWRKLKLVDASSTFAPRLLNPEHTAARTNMLVYYGGRELKAQRPRSFPFEWELRHSEFMACNNRNYLIQSSNIYHSLIVFLGSYPHSTLSGSLPLRNGGVSIFKPYETNSLDFPVFSFGDSKYAFKDSAWPESYSQNGVSENGQSYFGNQTSIMADGLSSNFGLPTVSTSSYARNENIDAEDIDILNYSSSYSYAYPEYSEYLQSKRNSTANAGFVTGMVQATVGGYPLNVTPLKMAEMSGKLFSYNRNYKATLQDRPQNESQQSFDSDTDWKDKHLDFQQKEIYKSLENVFLQDTGTGRRLANFLIGRKKETGYFYYGKTGTISDSERERKNDNMLMLTISKTDLSTATPENIANNKFYTLYFVGYYFNSPSWELIKEIISEVENSNLFKIHMDEQQ